MQPSRSLSTDYNYELRNPNYEFTNTQKNMKKIFAILTVSLLTASCSQKQNTENTDIEAGETTAVKEKIVAPAIVPETETFYNLDSSSAALISDPITYNVDLKNYNPEDEWKTECLSHTDRIALANMIFQAVYKGRLTPIDYFSEEVMPIDSVKALEKRFNRSEIGQIMFTEKWYFSESTLSLTKKVEAVTLGYERLDKVTGENHGFSPAFMVKLK